MWGFLARLLTFVFLGITFVIYGLSEGKNHTALAGLICSCIGFLVVWTTSVKQTVN